MTRDQRERLKALFNGALGSVPRTRHEWLSRQTGSDDARPRSRRVLLAHEGSEGFLETPVEVDPADIAGTEEPARPRALRV